VNTKAIFGFRQRNNFHWFFFLAPTPACGIVKLSRLSPRQASNCKAGFLFDGGGFDSFDVRKFVPQHPAAESYSLKVVAACNRVLAAVPPLGNFLSAQEDFRYAASLRLGCSGSVLRASLPVWDK